MFINYIRTNPYTYPATLEAWKRTPIIEDTNILYDKNGMMINNDKYLQFFTHSITHILQSNHYTIINKKKFKEELDKFIYTLSDSING